MEYHEGNKNYLSIVSEMDDSRVDSEKPVFMKGDKLKATFN